MDDAFDPHLIGGSDADTGDYRSLHTGSYYAASSNRMQFRDRLQGDVTADICVVGGGYTGLSTALALAEKGYDVCLLEAKAIGWGASGRNGGQVINGLNASLGKIRRQFGADASTFIGKQVQAGGQVIRDRIKRYAIDCDYKPGSIYAAYTTKQMRELEDKRARWRLHGMDDHEMLDHDGIRQHVGSEVYVGGMIDHSGGHLHPLNLALGEADAIEANGGRIFERSPVVGAKEVGGKHIVETAAGRVEARMLVLCGNAYLAGIAPEIEKRVMPVSTQIVATEPLGADLAASLLPTDMCVEDVRYVLDYFRLTADNRMLFGGGLVYGGTDPADIRKRLQPNLVKVYPQLRDVKLDYAWSGNFALSYSRVPQMGRLGSGAYFAHGYSGHGVTGSHLFGAILAEAIDGDAARFDAFAKFPYLSFPGGRALRVPYSMIGSWWYAMRDATGI